MSSLQEALEGFGERVNAHPRMRTLLKGWDREIAVRSEDTGQAFTLEVKGSRVVRIEGGAAPGLAIQLKASELTLVDIFVGTLSPTSEYVEGRLQVEASDKDQVKLDALSLVLWD